MENENVIPANECCRHYNIELSFVRVLGQYGLLSISIINEEEFIPYEQLSSLEKYIQLHYDLDINLEGIEAINHLLERIKNIQQEAQDLKNRLSVYER